MNEQEKRKWHLVILPFCVILGTIAWSFFTVTPFIELASNIFSIMALYYFFYHVHNFYIGYKVRRKSDQASKNNKANE